MPTSDAALLQISDLAVRFGGVQALSDVTFSVDHGEFVGRITAHAQFTFHTGASRCKHNRGQSQRQHQKTGRFGCHGITLGYLLWPSRSGQA